MEEQINQILSILLNSKKIPQMTLAGQLPSDSLFIFYNPNTQQVEATLKSNVIGQLIWKPLIMGFASTATETTTNQEIISHINNFGFQVSAGQIIIVEILVQKNDVPYRQKYLFKSNELGVFGTAVQNQVLLSEFYLISEETVNQDNAGAVFVELGDIGSSSLVDHINTTNSPDYNLLLNNIYIFTAIIDGVEKQSFYIGSLPKQLGSGVNVALETDFKEVESKLWYNIEGSEVKKGNGNFDLSLLEDGDDVRWKAITNNGFPAMISYGTYREAADSGNKQSEKSYEVPQLVIN